MILAPWELLGGSWGGLGLLLGALGRSWGGLGGSWTALGVYDLKQVDFALVLYRFGSPPMGGNTDLGWCRQGFFFADGRSTGGGETSN